MNILRSRKFYSRSVAQYRLLFLLISTSCNDSDIYRWYRGARAVEVQDPDLVLPIE